MKQPRVRAPGSTVIAVPRVGAERRPRTGSPKQSRATLRNLDRNCFVTRAAPRNNIAPRWSKSAWVFALCVSFIVFSHAAAAEQAPKRGGTLVFSVDAEPPNYDCHANFSFVFIHPVIPHYSTLLKFDTANYPQIVGDLAESWSVSADRRTYTFKLRRNVLFHDGSSLTSADVKASYERIIHPPEGVLSVRQADYAAITGIDTPDSATVVFHLQWPDAAMLANFASPWNCIYSAAKLKEDPLFPKTHVLGTGPFTFVEHVKKDHWTGRRWDKYFIAGKPYLDGYRADFIAGEAAVKAMESGRIMAQFRSFTPTERDAMVETAGDRVVVRESPWITYLALVFNVQHPPFDDARVRRALSLAIDRWHGAETLADTTFLKYVGGLMRPGTAMSIPEAELVTIPGFSRDITAARTEARRLLEEAGVPGLAVALTNRNDVPIPYGPAGDFVMAAWREIGVQVTQEMLNTKDWQTALETGRFAVATDLAADYFDDPTIQLARYVSRDLSPINHSGSTDRYLDALYIGQAISTDVRQRANIVRDFERHALTEAFTVPLLWWNRIIVTAEKLKGWNVSPSHYIGQDLADVWLQN
ncbi:MAG: ABC transporter substrate-binding protein [Alphaproteobacteria bacterium]|nr:ABC transporter substrate-binding protein [Alphaproteobacteria bacterium]